MTEPTFELADDRKSIHIKIPLNEGVVNLKTTWAQPATDEQVEAAKNVDWVAKYQNKVPGQGMCTRRVRLGPVTLWLWEVYGPPTWKFPHVYPTRNAGVGVLVGWLQHGYGFTFTSTR